jgi:hypothetical protein
MSRSLRYVLASVSFLWLCLAQPAAAHAGTIDAFMDAFDAEAFPVSTSFMWAGTYPGTLHKRTADTQDQPQAGESLEGVWDGSRYTSLNVNTLSTYVTASINTSLHTLSYTTAVGKASGILSLTYDSEDSADISLSGDTYFKLSYISNLSSCHPMTLTVTVTCNDLPVSKSYSIYGSNSNKRLRFSDFATCDFTKVTSIKFKFDASMRTGVNFTLTNGLYTGH